MVFKSQSIIWFAALSELCGILGAEFKAKRVVMMAQWVKGSCIRIWCASVLLYAVNGSLHSHFLVGSQYRDYLAHCDLY